MGDYPLKSVFHALTLLATYRISERRALSIEPDRAGGRVGSYPVRYLQYFHDSIDLDFRNKTEFLYTQCLLVSKKIEKEVPRVTWLTFKARYIGVLNPDSDTGDVFCLTTDEIATMEGITPRAIQKRCKKVLEAFKTELINRNLLSPEN